MLQVAMNAWLLEHPEEEEQWLKVKSFFAFLRFFCGPLYRNGPFSAPCIRDPE
jgi:hypothetical protein